MQKKETYQRAFVGLLAALAAAYCAGRASCAFRAAGGSLANGLGAALSLSSFWPVRLSGLGRGDALPSLAGFAAALLAWLYSFGWSDSLFFGKEYGTARWGGPKDSRPLKNPDFSQNILLTETEWLSLPGMPPKKGGGEGSRNSNVLVIGGSGSGKSRYAIKPQIAQMNASYIVTDAKGSLFHETGRMLIDAGYRLRLLNLVDRAHSHGYNPFAYIETEDDILKLVTNIIGNTNGEAQEKSSRDPFWDKAETALMEALFGYLVFELRPEDRSMPSVMRLLEQAEAREGEMSTLDVMFMELDIETSFAAKQYRLFKFASDTTAKSILVSVGVRLSAFNIGSVSRIFSSDDMALDRIGEEKTALFVILSDTDHSFNFIAAMLFQQLFDALVRRADSTPGGKLPMPVMCLLDEFANIGQIPGFPILISTIRSRNIGALICLQGLSQLKSRYEASWETIAGNCDSLLFLGGMEQSTIKYMSEVCGRQTVRSQSRSEQKGQSGSTSVSMQSVGRELITESEISTLGGRDCILKISRVSPFLSRKYPLEKHPNYRLLSDANPKAWLAFEDVCP
jgi:type IV secretion system protein VirD4